MTSLIEIERALHAKARKTLSENLSMLPKSDGPDAIFVTPEMRGLMDRTPNGELAALPRDERAVCSIYRIAAFHQWARVSASRGLAGPAARYRERARRETEKLSEFWAA